MISEPLEQSYSILDLGYNNLVNRYSVLSAALRDSFTPEMANVFTSGVAAKTLTSGELQGNTTVTEGYLQSENFVSGSAGWRLTPTSAELNVSTAVMSLDIPDATTANSFHVNSTGDMWLGANVASFNSSNDNALAYILKTGVAKFQSITLSNSVNISGLVSGSDLAIQQWNFSGTFSSTDVTNTLYWTTGTLVFMDGESFTISASNTGVITATTYVYFDKAASTTAFQSTTTYSTATGANKVLIAVGKPGTVVAGTTIFTDNFNSYSTGSLHGQGSWTTAGGGAGWQVQTSVVNEGANAISRTGLGLATKKGGSSINDGIITFYTRRTETSPGVTGAADFELWQGDPATGTRIAQVRTLSGNSNFFYVNSTPANVSFGTITSNTWYAIQVQWRSSDHKVRYNVNGGTWTSFVAGTSGNVWTTGLSFVNIVSTNGSAGETIYFDTIQSGLVVGNVSFQVFGGTGGISIDSSSFANINQLSDISANLGTITLGAMSGISITSGDISGLTTLAIRDTSAAFDVTFAATSSTTLTAGRTLTLDMVNAARTIKLQGNLDIGGALTTAAAFTTSGANALTLTTTGSTNVTLPTSGTLYGTATGSISSAQLLASLSDETGTGVAVFGTSPALTTPAFTGNPTGTITSGVYTPTRSAEANLDANVTMTEAQYLRVGNTVTVSGRFTADPTITVTATSFEITLPIASNIGAAEDIAGTAVSGAISGQSAEIIGVVANDTAKIQWVAGDVTSQLWSYTFSYQVI